MEFAFTVAVKIQKPIDEVFDAVYNPKKLSGYFTNGGASAPLDEGTVVTWAFADHPDKPISFPVTVKKLVKNQRIEFSWGASEGDYDPKTGDLPSGGGYETLVEMTFESLGPKETLITIREGNWRNTEGGLKGSYQNCGGWMHMSMCLKAYLEYGINLRRGSF
jgi:uncharacterized protein YndB with AHSA1/START domain